MLAWIRNWTPGVKRLRVDLNGALNGAGEAGAVGIHNEPINAVGRSSSQRRSASAPSSRDKRAIRHPRSRR